VKARSLVDSFNYAFDGVIYAFKTQRNIRLHFSATIAVLLASLIFQLTKVELLILLVTIAFVITAEMVNTAIEAAIDLVTQEYHPMAAIAKNVAAGAVLVAATISIVVGFLIFFPKIDQSIPRVIDALLQTPAYLRLVALMITVVAVIMGKSLTKTGRPVQGAMPSGHTALSASAATTIFLLSQNGLVAFLAVFLVLLVGESRIENKIHSFPEVVVGGLIGFLVTLSVFQFLH
jgi:diacylglycerol kinase (ATP)